MGAQEPAEGERRYRKMLRWRTCSSTHPKQAYPESLLQIAPLLADSAPGVAVGVAATLLLALQAWRRRLKGD